MSGYYFWRISKRHASNAFMLAVALASYLQGELTMELTMELCTSLQQKHIRRLDMLS